MALQVKYYQSKHRSEFDQGLKERVVFRKLDQWDIYSEIGALDDIFCLWWAKSKSALVSLYLISLSSTTFGSILDCLFFV